MDSSALWCDIVTGWVAFDVPVDFDAFVFKG